MSVVDRLHTVGRPMWLALLAMLMAAAAAYGLTPTKVMADVWPPLSLASEVPRQFGDWRELPDQVQLVTDPTVDATLRQYYSETLSRIYVNGKGQRVMLSLAYGRNQNSWSTAAHRPEFCYAAQGFTVAERGVHALLLNGHTIESVRVMTSRGPRHEPITYWVTLADSVAVPGLSRKLKQMAFGLQGMIVDGLLFRISSIGEDESADFALQAKFARDLEQSMSAPMRTRFFGH